jgi:hypothetical protein
MLRPVRSGQEGTMPAGMVLVVVLGALVVAMFLNGDAILRKANGKRDNPAWRIEVAERVSWVSGLFALDEPRNRIDQARGIEQTEGDNLDELLAEQQAGQTAAGDTSGSAGGDQEEQPTSGDTTPTTVDETPVLRTPTPGEPLKLWVGGDSISNDFGVAVERIATESGLFEVTRDSRVSTGLSRPDYFNWPEHLVKDVVPGSDPDVIFYQVGSNDAQNIPLDGGGVALGTPEWEAEYRDRVGKTMDLLRSPDNDRLVIWVGTPIMGPNSGVRAQDVINHIYWSEAQKRPWVRYFDTWAFFTDPAGNYAAALPSADGSQHTMRQGDNIHLSSSGSDRLAWAVWNKLGTLVDLNQSQVQPAPDQAPPDDVVERTEVPPTVG